MSSGRPKGILKTYPSSFVVQELIKPNLPVPVYDQSWVQGWQGDPVTTFELTKIGVSHQDAMWEVARQLGVSRSNVSDHGIKDKFAYTSQLVGVSGQFGGNFSHSNIFLVQKEGRKVSLRPGGHAGNRFGIRIISDASSLDLGAAESFLNLFGPQRFGEPGQEQVGLALLDGDYDRAGEVMMNSRNASKIEPIFRRKKSWKEAILDPAFNFDFGFEVVRWQSYLWNQLVLSLPRSELPHSLPVWSLEPDVRSLYRRLWDPRKLDEHAVKKLHQFTRRTVVQPTNFQAERGVLGWDFWFDLPPGSYATVLLAQLFDLDEGRWTT